MMSANSKIEWTHHTFSPWRGCTKISAGCANCYAETLSHRNPKTLGVWGDSGTRVVASESYWREPIKWDRWAASGTCFHCGGKSVRVTAGKCIFCDGTGSLGAAYRARVFCASLADVFEERAELDAPRHRLFDLILRTPNLDWLLLTKRPEVMIDYLTGHNSIGDPGTRIPHAWGPDGWPNVWLGVSAENQDAVDKRAPILLGIRAAVHFLSIEPLLGPMRIEDYLYVYRGHGKTQKKWPSGQSIKWTIVGGESGHGARPMSPDWVRDLRDQCRNGAFFFKQWGEFLHINPIQLVTGKPIVEFDGLKLQRLGKKEAGRLLDGRTWDQFPEVATS